MILGAAEGHRNARHAARVFKKRSPTDLIRYWLTPPADPQRAATIVAICQVYQEAPQLAEQGARTVSTDELTGVQALERTHPGLPLAPGKVERREFEYTRHGTRAFILSRDVVTGTLLAPACGPTRTEEDFLALMPRRAALREGSHPQGGLPLHP